MLLDNKANGRVADALKEALGPKSVMSMISRAFSIYGHAELASALARVKELRYLLPVHSGKPRGEQQLLDGDLAGPECERQFRNRLDQARVARACHDWLESVATIRAVNSPVPQSLFHVTDADGHSMAISGSSCFNAAGLGVVASPSFEMNTCFKSPEETGSLLQWFDSIWSDPSATRDVKTEFLAELRLLFEDKSPELITDMTLNDFRMNLGEYLKTYVDLRSIFELNRRYGFTKFIIVVPSVAIKEGVYKSLQITEEHFKGLYDNVQFDHFVYDSQKLGQVRNFATSDYIQIMVINIDAFRKSFTDPEKEDKANIIHRPHDRMTGSRPIEFIQATNPIVIIDEPQSVDTTQKSKEAIAPSMERRHGRSHQ